MVYERAYKYFSDIVPKERIDVILSSQINDVQDTSDLIDEVMINVIESLKKCDAFNDDNVEDEYLELIMDDMPFDINEELDAVLALI